MIHMNKKFLSLILGVSLLLTSSAVSADDDNVETEKNSEKEIIEVFDETIDNVNGYKIINNRSLSPLRYVTEEIGATVYWIE